MGLYQTNSSDLGQFVNLRDGNGTTITSTTISAKQGLDVNVINPMTVGVADASTFTYGTSTFLPVGGVYNTSPTALTSGQTGSFNLTALRDLRVNLRTAAGAEIGTSASPIFTQDNSLAAMMASSAATVSSVTVSTTSASVLAANTARRSYSIYNPTLFRLFVAMAATATTSAYTYAIPPQTLYEPQVRYTGAISIIGGVGTSGSVQVTEYTA